MVGSGKDQHSARTVASPLLQQGGRQRKESAQCKTIFTLSPDKQVVGCESSETPNKMANTEQHLVGALEMTVSDLQDIISPENINNHVSRWKIGKHPP